MPALVLAIPAAIGLAWLALRGGRRRGRRIGPPELGGPVDFGEPGHDGGVPSGDEDPWKRQLLPEERPHSSGGEIGGPYGPGTQTSSPSAPESGYAESPSPTQTLISVARGVGGLSPAQTTYQRGLVGPSLPTSPALSPAQIAAIIGPAPAPTGSSSITLKAV